MPESVELDSQLLTRYLLGSASEEETARLDELSVTDQDLAWRLRDLENNLLDSYARGELSSDEMQRFPSYLSSLLRRQRAAFARTLYQYQRERMQEGTNIAEAARKQIEESHWLRMPLRLAWRPQAASAALLIVFIAGGT